MNNRENEEKIQQRIVFNAKNSNDNPKVRKCSDYI